MNCDVCKVGLASTEAIYEDVEGSMLILSVCDSLECQSKFVRISNAFSLTTTYSE